MWVLYRSQLEVVPRNQVGGRLMSTGGSTGRSNHAFHLQHHQSSLSALHMATTNNSSTIEKRHSSLRLSWRSSQGSLSRALGLRPRNEKASPSSSSDTGSLISCQYMSSIRSNSPPPPQLPPRPNPNNANGRRHRRVKSIGDIEYISKVPVSTSV